MSDSIAGSLMKVKQAARHLGMAPSSLYRLCKIGRVPAYAAGMKGRGVRVDLQEVKSALRRPSSSYMAMQK
jgi:excisionase family DNA binding protein